MVIVILFSSIWFAFWPIPFLFLFFFSFFFTPFSSTFLFNRFVKAFSDLPFFFTFLDRQPRHLHTPRIPIVWRKKAPICIILLL